MPALGVKPRSFERFQTPRIANRFAKVARLLGTADAELKGIGRMTLHRHEGAIMKILLAVDGSPCSEAAIQEMAMRPWPEESEIRVFSSFELPLPPTPEAWAIPPDYFEELTAAAREHARSIVASAVELLKTKLGNSTVITGAISPGSPGVMILDEAQEWGADLIVLGSHGYSAWKRFLLGSVSQAIVAHAKCSVEVVRCPVAANG